MKKLLTILVTLLCFSAGTVYAQVVGYCSEGEKIDCFGVCAGTGRWDPIGNCCGPEDKNAAGFCIPPLLLCIDQCGNDYPTRIGGWGDTNDIDDLAHATECTGVMRNWGTDPSRTYFCAHRPDFMKEHALCKSCGGLFPYEVGGWGDTNDIDDIMYDDNCSGSLTNRGTDDPRAYLCTSLEPDEQKVRICRDQCGGRFNKPVGGWKDGNDIDDIAFDRGCETNYQNWGTGPTHTMVCAKHRAPDIRLCVDNCGGDYPHDLGGWNDSNDIDDITYSGGCGGALKNRGPDRSRTRLCGFKNAIGRYSTCLSSCGGDYPYEVGGWQDSNDIDDVARGNGCSGNIENHDPDAEHTKICTNLPPDEQRVRVCINSCGGDFDIKVGGWSDSNDIDSFAFDSDCASGYGDKGTSARPTLFCSK